MAEAVWERCLEKLQVELPAQQFDTWLRPLHAVRKSGRVQLLAPNEFVRDWVTQHYAARIDEVMKTVSEGGVGSVSIIVGSVELGTGSGGERGASLGYKRDAGGDKGIDKAHTGLNADFTFDNFVEGKCNQLGRAAALQVSENPGNAYNPLFIYGGVGLGKTHLMHAVGNVLAGKRPDAKVVYLHSERFLGDMVRALQHNTINDFKRYYRSVDMLLIDDIQFFARKERSQEEFFHTFNALMEGHQQVVMTCDRYPKEVDGLEERLKSRFGWGLTVAMEPPELETRIAILKKKAEISGFLLPDEVAFFIGKNLRSHVRELEGALRRVVAISRFTGQAITLELARDALRDLLALQARLVNIENIQKTVGEYYRIRVAELVSKRRTRSIARPRQIAMALAKELTNRSLPEIGEAFGGRDHSTVIHACRKIAELRCVDTVLAEDYKNLLRKLSS